MTAIDSLNALDLPSYIGKPVGELLDAIPAYDRFIYVDNRRPGILGGANFLYGEKWLRVRIEKVEHQPRFNEHYAWDFELFKKEILTGVEWKH